jgi:hypothetical protein
MAPLVLQLKTQAAAHMPRRLTVERSHRRSPAGLDNDGLDATTWDAAVDISVLESARTTSPGATDSISAPRVMIMPTRRTASIS